MRILLDTHVFIWWDQGALLSERARTAIMESEQVYVSAVVGWEIEVKVSLGKIETTRDVSIAAAESGFEELPVRLAHTALLGELPWHHRDPFDRMLVAQAKAERLTLVTRNRAFRPYDVRLLPA